MFEDKYIFKFVCAILAVASIMIPGLIVPVISFVVAIALLIYKFKQGKDSPEGFELLMLDIVCIIILIIVDIGFFAFRISVAHEYSKYNSSTYSLGSSQEMSSEDVAEKAIYAYKTINYSQFSGSGNHLSAIKSGFLSFLKNDLEISDATINGNKITCTVGFDKIVFLVTRNDIKYNIEKSK